MAWQAVRSVLRATVTLVAVVVCVALADCGAPASATTTYAATCRVLSVTPNYILTPTALQAVGSPLDGAGLGAFSRCVTDAKGVQALYAAAFALPHTTGFGSCPKGAGVTYNLTFLHGNLAVRQMTMMADTCLCLYITKTDIRFTGIPFQRQVAGLLGLSRLSPSLPLTGDDGIT